MIYYSGCVVMHHITCVFAPSGGQCLCFDTIEWFVEDVVK